MRISETPSSPGELFQIVPLPELVKLHLDRGIQQPQLNQQFICDGRCFRKIKGLRKQVREVHVEGSEGMD